jgi:hypothetical protein
VRTAPRRFYCQRTRGRRPSAPTRAPAVLTTHLNPGAAVLHAAAKRAQRLVPAERGGGGDFGADVTPSLQEADSTTRPIGKGECSQAQLPAGPWSAAHPVHIYGSVLQQPTAYSLQPTAYSLQPHARGPRPPRRRVSTALPAQPAYARRDWSFPRTLLRSYTPELGL